jgi:hypothetical protein
MSADSRAVLLQLEEAPKTIDQIEARTGIDRKRLAYMLRDLRRLGWVVIAAFRRKARWRVRVYGLARRVPPAYRAPGREAFALSPNVAAMYRAFRMGLPTVRRRGRIVRGAR